MNIKTLGIDIAKNVFELHGVDNHGKTVLKKRVSRALVQLDSNVIFCNIRNFLQGG